MNANEIYQNNDEPAIKLVDKNDYFLVYEKKNIKKILPSINDKDFKEKVKNDLYELKKFEINKDLLTRIDKKEFIDSDFRKIVGNNNLEIINIKSINDNDFLNNDSVKLLYSMSKGSYSLIVDKKNNIYLAKIDDVVKKNLGVNNEMIETYQKQSDKIIKNNLYSTYDNLLNEKYKIKINQSTLERVKNYFR